MMNMVMLSLKKVMNTQNFNKLTLEIPKIIKKTKKIPAQTTTQRHRHQLYQT